MAFQLCCLRGWIQGSPNDYALRLHPESVRLAGDTAMQTQVVPSSDRPTRTTSLG